MRRSGRSAAWLAHLTGGQGVGSSNLLAPTIIFTGPNELAHFLAPQPKWTHSEAQETCLLREPLAQVHGESTVEFRSQDGIRPRTPRGSPRDGSGWLVPAPRRRRELHWVHNPRGIRHIAWRRGPFAYRPLRERRRRARRRRHDHRPRAPAAFDRPKTHRKPQRERATSTFGQGIPANSADSATGPISRSVASESVG